MTTFADKFLPGFENRRNAVEQKREELLRVIDAMSHRYCEDEFDEGYTVAAREIAELIRSKKA